ncbi:glycosyltransferase family 39 protein [Candidatus Daviesbacteria bacterium]|nr:glycosyltransferase family 39 protein [Candidatus Daviesbacteria bacterium]
MSRLKLSSIDSLVFTCLILSLPLFFYKLGQSSLVSWDEAWYADISQNILIRGDLFNLVFNSRPFVDQPPGGFWMTATTFNIFGLTEFSARLSSAVLGFLSLYVLYLLGRKLFNRWVGFASSIALCSSFWFLNRARSGNLDIPLTFFFLLTLYLGLLASKNRNFFIPFSASLAFLYIVKSLLPFAILPALLIIFWKNKIYKLKDYLIPALFVFAFYGIWLILQLINDVSLVQRHLFHSTRGASLGNDFLNSLRLFKTYLHNGIGKWFWPGMLGIVMGLSFIKEKRFLLLLVFFFSYATPFVFSQQLHIWHLIPLHPIVILLFFGGSFNLGTKLFNLLKIKASSLLLGSLLMAFSLYFAYLQIKTSWYQFIDIPAFVSDEAILSREASKYPGKIYIDGDFDPAATFYSRKEVEKIKKEQLKQVIDQDKQFLVITNTWRLEVEKIDPQIYEILKQDRDKVLVRNIN